MKLTQRNYYSKAADTAYMSTHQFANWQQCPAREYARIQGDYVPPDKRYFFIGSYVDCALTTPRSFKTFRKKNADRIYKKPSKADIEKWCNAANNPVEWDPKKTISSYLEDHPGCKISAEPLADIVQANDMIKYLMADPVAETLLDGEGQVIVTGDIGGIRWKGLVDILQKPRKVFVDLKTSASFEMSWCDDVKARVPWYEVFNYWRQMAIYQELCRQTFGEEYLPVILAVSKETKSVDGKTVADPDKQALSFENKDRLEHELQSVKDALPEIIEYKNGNVELPGCGRCDYCKSQKQLSLQKAESWRA